MIYIGSDTDVNFFFSFIVFLIYWKAYFSSCFCFTSFWSGL